MLQRFSFISFLFKPLLLKYETLVKIPDSMLDSAPILQETAKRNIVRDLAKLSNILHINPLNIRGYMKSLHI